ncbi:lysozyme inhibitor LprI family protein [Maritalea sp.]|uniref:lysozyme inhibitor LprI family protein n=1 Tax=Maritalea sp. TaxID=2003361 RepID=UPI003EF0CE6E
MNKYHLPLAAALAISSMTAANAQEFTPDDEAQLQQCVETVHEIQRAGEEISMRECIGAASRVCMEAPGGDTTVGIMQCTLRENAWWDSYLNFLYQDLKANLSTEQFASLRNAQRAWITYRDAKCGFEYEYWKEGTIRTTFHSSCLLDATATRAIDLAGYLDWTSM